MIRRPPRSTRTDTLCPYTTRFRSTSVKVTRVALLAPMRRLVARWLGRSGGTDATARIPLRLPWFIIGFLGLAAINSLVAIPRPAQDAAATAAQEIGRASCRERVCQYV